MKTELMDKIKRGLEGIQGKPEKELTICTLDLVHPIIAKTRDDPSEIEVSFGISIGDSHEIPNRYGFVGKEETLTNPFTGGPVDVFTFRLNGKDVSVLSEACASTFIELWNVSDANEVYVGEDIEGDLG